MGLVHYSDHQVSGVSSKSQKAELPGGAAFKPVGLWVSVEGEFDWHAWCVANGFRLDHLTHVHDVTLAEGANILRLCGERAVLEFSEEWIGASLIPDAPYRFNMSYIRWADVAKRWQGIVIAPYVWSLRYDLMWYNGWDCASGCIWDATAIASIILREVVPVPVREGD